MEEDRPDIDYTEVFGNKYPEPTSTEKPIEIIGVGNRMGIKTGNGYTNEWGRNLDQEEVSMIKSNLQSPSIANPEYFGLQKPDEEEMQVFEEMQQYKDYVKKTYFKGVSDPLDYSGNKLLYGEQEAKDMRTRASNYLVAAEREIRNDYRSKKREQEKIDAQMGNVVPSLADGVKKGLDAPIAIKNTRGANVNAAVKKTVRDEYPNFDFNMADANYKWKQSATNQRTINFVGGALPRLGALDAQLKELPNVDLNVINRAMRQVLTEFGKPAYTNYESNRNAIVQEINTALSGTSQSSDVRLQLELENLKSARSPQQIKGAIENLRLALEARLDVDLSPLYPIEVVRGEKTMSQYKKELYSKYRNDYSNHFGGEQKAQEVGGGTAPPVSALKEGVQRTFKNGQVWALINGKPVRVK
jgi:hypothetical protein